MQPKEFVPVQLLVYTSPASLNETYRGHTIVGRKVKVKYL